MSWFSLSLLPPSFTCVLFNFISCLGPFSTSRDYSLCASPCFLPSFCLCPFFLCVFISDFFLVFYFLNVVRFLDFFFNPMGLFLGIGMLSESDLSLHLHLWLAFNINLLKWRFWSSCSHWHSCDKSLIKQLKRNLKNGSSCYTVMYSKLLPVKLNLYNPLPIGKLVTLQFF